VVDSCEHGNEPSGSIKGGEFFWLLPKKDFAPWSWSFVSAGLLS